MVIIMPNIIVAALEQFDDNRAISTIMKTVDTNAPTIAPIQAALNMLA